jgi:hypothetical protein
VALQHKASLSIALAILTTLLSINPTNAAVGRVTEQTGPTEIVRNKKSVPSAVNASVQSNDTIITARARAKLEFEDKTTVRITEQSKLVIDDFVYDPKKGTGKLALKMALGTARYASGQIAKNNPQQVAVKTPTASIAVRGTDFSMTVDELGRSLVMLLPSCDNQGCVTGAIEVSNEAGTVLLEQAYQATLVRSASTPPTAPVIISIDQANINNMLIIAPPPQLQDEEFQTETKTALDVNFLNQDFLKYNELDEDELKKFTALDQNFLDGELLVNMLDASNAQLAASQEQLSKQNQLLPGYNAASGLKYYVDANDESKLVLDRSAAHIARVTVDLEQSLVLNITQDGVALTQPVNRSGSTTITIIQK